MSYPRNSETCLDIRSVLDCSVGAQVLYHEGGSRIYICESGTFPKVTIFSNSMAIGERQLQGYQQRSLDNGAWLHRVASLFFFECCIFQMLEFCQTIKPSLQDYEADGVRMRSSFLYIPTNPRAQAWPTLLDDFVIWKKSHSSNGNAGDMDVDH